jgi:hypothetical protein
MAEVMQYDDNKFTTQVEKHGFGFIAGFQSKKKRPALLAGLFLLLMNFSLNVSILAVVGY